MGVLVKIAEKFEKLFERSATKDDPNQIDRDTQDTANDATKQASDAAVDEAKKHTLHDLRDLGIKAVPKLGWLKFTAAVAAMFAGVFTYVSTRPPTPEERDAQELRFQQREMQREGEQLNTITISPEQMNIMIGGLMVESAPTPTPEVTAPAAAAMPPAIAAVAAEPITVEVTTMGGQRHEEKQSTVGQVYLQSPVPVRHMMEQRDPPKIDHGYDHEDPNDCFHRHCLGGGFHKDFTVNAVDGNGVNFGSIHIHN